MRSAQKTLFGILLYSLFVTSGCGPSQISPAQQAQSTPTPLSMGYTTSSSSSTAGTEARFERRVAQIPYLQNVTGYKYVPLDEWFKYNTGNIYSEPRLAGRALSIEDVVVNNRFGVKEYLSLLDTKTNERFWVTLDSLGKMESLYSSEEYKTRIARNDEELSYVVLNSVLNNKDPLPEVERIVGSQNPFVAGNTLKYVLSDTRVANFTSGEIYPFTHYYISYSGNKLQLDINTVPESVVLVAALRALGLDVYIPWQERNLEMILGEEVAKNPESTKLHVRFTYDGDRITVAGDVNNSRLVRIGKNIYYITTDERTANRLSGQRNQDTRQTIRTVRQTNEEYNRMTGINQQQQFERKIARTSTTAKKETKEFLEADRLQREREAQKRDSERSQVEKVIEKGVQSLQQKSKEIQEIRGQLPQDTKTKETKSDVQQFGRNVQQQVQETKSDIQQFGRSVQQRYQDVKEKVTSSTKR